MKGYKVFTPDWTCRGFQYEVGKTYKHDGEMNICHSGFHFCSNPADCFNYYKFDPDNKVAEVEALGRVESDGDKSVTDEIRIVREIPWCELLELVNVGKGNTGLRNSGSWNSGSCNSGDRNSGSCNSGSWNSGDRNSGDCNSGDWNSGDYNAGFFNTVSPPLLLFNKPTNLDRFDVLTNAGVSVLNAKFRNNWWICSAEMTEKEKEEHPEHETLGGYLKIIDYKTACAIMWENLDDEEKQAVKEIPNFDADIFKEITGIEV